MSRFTQNQVGSNAEIDVLALAEKAGKLTTIEPCRRCGKVGEAYYEHGGWGFAPRGPCPDPKCGERANLMGASVAVIEGGRQS
jgi:hypothetical protein